MSNQVPFRIKGLGFRNKGLGFKVEGGVAGKREKKQCLKDLIRGV